MKNMTIYTGCNIDLFFGFTLHVNMIAYNHPDDRYSVYTFAISDRNLNRLIIHFHVNR